MQAICYPTEMHLIYQLPPSFAQRWFLQASVKAREAEVFRAACTSRMDLDLCGTKCCLLPVPKPFPIKINFMQHKGTAGFFHSLCENNKSLIRVFLNCPFFSCLHHLTILSKHQGCTNEGEVALFWRGRIKGVVESDWVIFPSVSCI